MIYRVVEKFISINGEGTLAGELAVFIRFAGCNLRCSYCDTMWANRDDVEYIGMSEDDIYRYILDTGITNVTLTGGEPLLQEGICRLLELLASDSTLRVEIETNGSVDISEFTAIGPKRPVFTLDYKLGSSGMEHAMLEGNFKYLQRQDTVKFVAGSHEDIETAACIMEKHALPERCGVHISAVFGRLDMNTIVEFMKTNRMNNVRLQPQLHKIIWHPDTRGV